MVAYDRRGFGRSEPVWSGFDYDTLALDLQSLLEGLELRDATLVGFSMGGGEVVRYLSRFGKDRISRAVLMSAVTPFLLKTDDNAGGVDQKVFAEIEKKILEDRPAFLRGFGPQFFGRSTLNHTVSEAVLQWSEWMGFSGSLRATLETAKAWSTTDFRAEMEEIDIPVLVIHGTSDATVPIDASGRKSVQLLRNATLSEYDGEPHGLFLTAADRLNQELLDFINGSETRSRATELARPMPIGDYSTTVG